MWHDLVSQANTTAQLLPFTVVDLFYRHPLVFSATVLAGATLASMLCFESARPTGLRPNGTPGAPG